MLKGRVIEPEQLDDLPPGEGRRNLEDLVRINRHFGGHSVLRNTLRQVVNPSDAFSLLDVGAASGDSAGIIRQCYPRSRVVSLDYNATNLSAAPQPKLLGDAFALPFRQCSFDYVLCSLFLHHFTNEQVVELLRGFYAVASKGLFVCDLERHILPYLFLPASRFLLGWDALTVSDGLKSVRASFRSIELQRLAEAANIPNPQVRSYRPAFRVTLIATK